MGHKRVRNRVPALPEAVKNLLAIHSLEAWPDKYEEFPRGARAWQWKVIKAGSNHITAFALFTMKGTPPLEFWLDKVDECTKRRLAFGIDFETYTRHWNSGGEIRALWRINMADIEARIAATTKFP